MAAFPCAKHLLSISLLGGVSASSGSTIYFAKYGIDGNETKEMVISYPQKNLKNGHLQEKVYRYQKTEPIAQKRKGEVFVLEDKRFSSDRNKNVEEGNSLVISFPEEKRNEVPLTYSSTTTTFSSLSPKSQIITSTELQNNSNKISSNIASDTVKELKFRESEEESSNSVEMKISWDSDKEVNLSNQIKNSSIVESTVQKVVIPSKRQESFEITTNELQPRLEEAKKEIVNKEIQMIFPSDNVNLESKVYDSNISGQNVSKIFSPQKQKIHSEEITVNYQIPSIEFLRKEEKNFVGTDIENIYFSNKIPEVEGKIFSPIISNESNWEETNFIQKDEAEAPIILKGFVVKEKSIKNNFSNKVATYLASTLKKQKWSKNPYCSIVSARTAKKRKSIEKAKASRKSSKDYQQNSSHVSAHNENVLSPEKQIKKEKLDNSANHIQKQTIIINNKVGGATEIISILTTQAPERDQSSKNKNSNSQQASTSLKTNSTNQVSYSSLIIENSPSTTKTLIKKTKNTVQSNSTLNKGSQIMQKSMPSQNNIKTVPFQYFCRGHVHSPWRVPLYKKDLCPEDIKWMTNPQVQKNITKRHSQRTQQSNHHHLNSSSNVQHHHKGMGLMANPQTEKYLSRSSAKRYLNYTQSTNYHNNNNYHSHLQHYHKHSHLSPQHKNSRSSSCFGKNENRWQSPEIKKYRFSWSRSNSHKK